MSLSDVVLCITSYDAMICVGTADGKLHFLQINDAETERVCAKKPSLLDSIELSKRATTCCCYIAEEACLWVASGPAIYVVSIGLVLVCSYILSSYHEKAIKGYNKLAQEFSAMHLSKIGNILPKRASKLAGFFSKLPL